MVMVMVWMYCDGDGDVLITSRHNAGYSLQASIVSRKYIEK